MTIVDGVKVGGVAATKDSDTYKVTLGSDATDFAVEGSWHIQLKGVGDTYTNRDDNISILSNAGNSCEGYTFKQTVDRDLSSIANFTLIGTNDAPFKGIQRQRLHYQQLNNRQHRQRSVGAFL